MEYLDNKWVLGINWIIWDTFNLINLQFIYHSLYLCYLLDSTNFYIVWTIHLNNLCIVGIPYLNYFQETFQSYLTKIVTLNLMYGDFSLEYNQVIPDFYSTLHIIISFLAA